MARIAASIVAWSIFGVLPPERPMMKWTRASPPSGKAGVVGRQPALEHRLQIGADLLAYDAVVAVARHEDEDRDEAVELIGAHQRSDARPLDQPQNGFGVLAQDRHRNLEQLVARIALQHVDQCLAGVIFRVETGFGDDGFGFRPEIRDLHHRARVGSRGEQADDAQLAGKHALGGVRLDADVIEIDAAVHRRFGIGLGDDQRFRPVQEGANFRRRRHRFGAAPQHQHVGIGEDAKAGLVGALQHATLLAAGVFELAHAEEGEIVVAQPFEKGDRFSDMGLVERHRSVAELRDCLVEAGQHRLPVGDSGAHLA